jgi:hypothetical protein
VVRLLFAATAVLLVAIALVGGSSAVPPGANQFAPPPTPRPGELAISLSAADLAQRLGVAVELAPNQLTAGGVAGHVDLLRGRALVVLPRDDLRGALQSVLDQEQAHVGLARVRSVAITPDQLMLIGTRS